MSQPNIFATSEIENLEQKTLELSDIEYTHHTQRILEKLEALSEIDIARTYHFSLKVISKARSLNDAVFEIHAALHAVNAALRLGDFHDARNLLTVVFDLLEQISGIQGKPLALSTSASTSTTVKLSHDLERLLTPLGKALEASDLETIGHIERVVNLTQTFGQHLGLSASQLFSLRIGAYLHDIGKMAIPRSILQKPAKLSVLERRIVERHSAIGALITQLLPSIPSEALSIVRHHHEHWNGGGYPNALSETTIPLLVRIFSIIDVFDALRHARPYKTAWSLKDSLNEINAQSGRQFDPEIAKRFVMFFEDNNTDSESLAQ
jgi:HD-GYP domain-containing protein (c-di-GMP phosphodiesterase class II)